MLCTNTAYNEKPAFYLRLCLYFKKIRIFPKFLSRLKIDSMLFKVGLALVVIELEFVPEYILYFFYSFGKIVG